MKKISLTIALIIPLFIYAQSPDKYEYHNKLIKEACVGGNGNGTFTASVPFMEKVLLTKMTKKSFDKTLPHFVDQGKVGFSYNEKTNDHDVPEYEITYVLLKDGNPTNSFIITIGKEINAPITGINILSVTSLKCDKLIQSALGSGFYFRSSVSNSQKRYYSNDKKNLEIIVTKRRDGGFNFYMFKI
jgi:hypothetical protein